MIGATVMKELNLHNNMNERKHKFKHTNNDRKQITYLLRRRLLGNYCIQKLIQVLETNNASFTEFKAFT